MPGHSVLMVCLGNICRSPIAEAVFRNVAAERGLQADWTVDSCGTGGWHTGSQPDHRSMEVLRRHQVDYRHEARQLCADDFDRFDFIFGMDAENVAAIRRYQQREGKSKCAVQVAMLGDHHPDGPTTIHDPYYDSGSEGFEECYQRCVRSVNAFLDKQKKK